MVSHTDHIWFRCWLNEIMWPIGWTHRHSINVKFSSKVLEPCANLLLLMFIRRGHFTLIIILTLWLLVLFQSLYSARFAFSLSSFYPQYKILNGPLGNPRVTISREKLTTMNYQDNSRKFWNSTKFHWQKMNFLFILRILRVGGTGELTLYIFPTLLHLVPQTIPNIILPPNINQFLPPKCY